MENILCKNLLENRFGEKNKTLPLTTGLHFSTGANFPSGSTF